MTLASIFKKTEKLLADNSPAILTGIGVTGTIVTAYLTGKASVEAAQVIRDYEWQPKSVDIVEVPLKERAKLVWKLYIPAVGSGVLTIACIITANRIGNRRAAAMAAAYSLSEKAYAEYKDKVVEKLGENKERAVRDEIAQERVNRAQPSEKDIIITGNGEVLCNDSLTGRYFLSSIETIKKAQNDINYIVLHEMYASLSDFYERIGLSATPYSEEVGWNSDHMLEITFHATITEDSRPCLVVDYVVTPTRGYNQLH